MPVIQRAELYLARAFRPEMVQAMNNLSHRDEKIRLTLLKIFAGEGRKSQRDLASQLGISLGKTNYWIRRLSQESLITIARSKNAGNRYEYTYTLTSRGLEERFQLLVHCLSRKLREYDDLRKEISEINKELVQYGGLRLEDTESLEI
jgi:EPS-associated MarR family transcriptional regulator